MLIMRMSAAAVSRRHANWTNGILLQPPQLPFRPPASIKTTAIQVCSVQLERKEADLVMSCIRAIIDKHGRIHAFSSSQRDDLTASTSFSQLNWSQSKLHVHLLQWCMAMARCVPKTNRPLLHTPEDEKWTWTQFSHSLRHWSFYYWLKELVVYSQV